MGGFNLNFYFISQRNALAVYRKSALDLVGQFFLKMMLGGGGYVWMGGQKIHGGRGGMPWMMP